MGAMSQTRLDNTGEKGGERGIQWGIERKEEVKVMGVNRTPMGTWSEQNERFATEEKLLQEMLLSHTW